VRDLLRQLKEEEIADIIFNFGGERYSRRIAKAIKERVRRKPIATAGEFADIIREALPKQYERGRIDPATRTFQAFRIYANGELDNVSRILEVLPEIMAPRGRVAIISFHSLEDRLVKQGFKKLVKANRADFINEKPIGPTREAIKENPRSRSAKLRAIIFR
jgi:16S rRNA (cytosine1402-N4)-methyltransferase